MLYLLTLLAAGLLIFPYVLVIIVIQGIFRPFFPQKIRIISNITLSIMCRYLLYFGQTTVRVKGLENIPKDGCIFMCNHQSSIDILVIYGYIKKPLSMIAKKSLARVPIVGLWMKNLGCYLIDKTNPGQAKKVFETAKNIIQQQQYSVLIYPEGTRSRSEKMGPFRPGSIKLPLIAQCPIVPITISGSWKLMYNNHKFGRKFVDLIVHPPILLKPCNGIQKEELLIKIENTIKNGFTSANQRSTPSKS